ncbi:SDR family NAD(P)-dependent oxidoreductase [Hyalangium versicolor]|uniref:SDR family NAD(P)-dependent oxidoreductase n=1 Tax=Hyalangium versicolor TaxID=2861190 RepID=UPI001CD03E94|nr:SDR family oxidoreductase [Hyalangium versicolor]
MTDPTANRPQLLSPSGPFPYRGHRALITGASGGIGEAFARTLASRGMNLVLVARSEARLRTLATELSKAHGIQAEVLAADLSREGSPRELHARCEERGLSVDLLINNAGFGGLGAVEGLSFQSQHEQVMLNVTAVMDLCRLFLPAMIERGLGGILNVSSIAGYQPVPYMAVYGATKAFVLSFTEALWAENRDRGVRAVALCPGPVETGFFDVVGTREAAVGTMVTPESVVLAGLRALDRGNPSVIPGWRNFIQSHLPRFAPRAFTARMSAQVMKPRSLAAAATSAKAPSLPSGSSSTSR